MEPAIRYAPTADGVSIAYYDEGHGAPLVVLPTIPWSNIQAEFSHFGFHPALAASFRLLRYDVRGAGLSQRDVTDFSLDALHLAAALAVGSDLAGVVTYDTRMGAAARSLGLAVVSPGRD